MYEHSRSWGCWGILSGAAGVIAEISVVGSSPIRVETFLRVSISMEEDDLFGKYTPGAAGTKSGTAHSRRGGQALGTQVFFHRRSVP